jgi:hypothetical protein
MEKSEKRILELINESKGEDLLNDEKLIDALDKSKQETLKTK